MLQDVMVIFSFIDTTITNFPMQIPKYFVFNFCKPSSAIAALIGLQVVTTLFGEEI